MELAPAPAAVYVFGGRGRVKKALAISRALENLSALGCAPRFPDHHSPGHARFPAETTRPRLMRAHGGLVATARLYIWLAVAAGRVVLQLDDASRHRPKDLQGIIRSCLLFVSLSMRRIEWYINFVFPCKEHDAQYTLACMGVSLPGCSTPCLLQPWSGRLLRTTTPHCTPPPAGRGPRAHCMQSAGSLLSAPLHQMEYYY
jgi:hypothetical protein